MFWAVSLVLYLFCRHSDTNIEHETSITIACSPAGSRQKHTKTAKDLSVARTVHSTTQRDEVTQLVTLDVATATLTQKRVAAIFFGRDEFSTQWRVISHGTRQTRFLALYQILTIGKMTFFSHRIGLREQN